MKYTVTWKPKAVRQLAQAFVDAMASPGGEANRITRAVSEADRMLAMRPDDVGESRSPGERVVVVEPLTVFFSLSSDNRTVSVLYINYRRTGA